MFKTSSMRRAGAVFSALAVVLAAGCAMVPPAPTAGSAATATATPAADPPTSLLWVGNSFFYYNNSLHNLYGRLARAAAPNVRQRSVSVTISGSGADWHDLASYFRADGIGRYSFVGDNEIVFNPPGRQFDAVIMMDCSQCPIHPQLGPVFHDMMKKHSGTALSHGVRPVLFMSWAYKDKPEMTAQLAEQYTRAGKANQAKVIPAGLAFARAIAQRPLLELYQPDKRHPTLAGSYLAACTTYAALHGKSPEGNRFTAGLAPELAAFLQTVAWQTVQAYSGV